MLDGLLGRGGFSSKCKSLIKPTRARIEALRRRAEAKQRFLKEDLAKLLANGLDVNAYGRTEEFIAGLNLLSCYNFIDQSCEYILKQLSIMQKQGQCPEECRETVASLMFAAARFSDLPELRDLRDVFQERYGNGFECFVNQVFVEKLSSKPLVIEKRLKLLQDIAAEFSIQWDSKGFKQRMDKPSTLPPESASKTSESKNNDTPLTIKSSGSSYRDKKPEIFYDDRMNRGRKENHGYKQEPLASRAGTNDTGDNDDRLFRRKASEKHGFENNDSPLTTKISGSSYRNTKPEMFDHDRVNRGRKEKQIENGDNNDRLFRTKREFSAKSPVRTDNDRDNRPEILGNNRVAASPPDLSYENQQNSMKSTRKASDEEAEVVMLKPCNNNLLPPPYVKSNIPPPYSKPKDHAVSNRTTLDVLNPDKIKNDIPLPKPRSMRRKHSKSSSTSHDDIGSSEDARIVKRISSNRRKERKGLQILFDDEHYHRDDEEKMMDKLLLHYSKKPSAYDIGKLKKKKSRSNTSKSPHHRRGDEVNNGDMDIIAPLARSISLPGDQMGEPEPKKVYGRANSFQPDNQAKHVHPKLPDYDDLAARFAALRGR